MKNVFKNNAGLTMLTMIVLMAFIGCNKEKIVRQNEIVAETLATQNSKLGEFEDVILFEEYSDEYESDSDRPKKYCKYRVTKDSDGCNLKKDDIICKRCPISNTCKNSTKLFNRTENCYYKVKLEPTTCELENGTCTKKGGAPR